MSIDNIHPDDWIALIVVLTICWTVSLYLAFFFVLISTGVFKALSIILLLAEVLIGVASVWLLITITGE